MEGKHNTFSAWMCNPVWICWIFSSYFFRSDLSVYEHFTRECHTYICTSRRWSAKKRMLWFLFRYFLLLLSVQKLTVDVRTEQHFQLNECNTKKEWIVSTMSEAKGAKDHTSCIKCSNVFYYIWFCHQHFSLAQTNNIHHLFMEIGVNFWYTQLQLAWKMNIILFVQHIEIMLVLAPLSFSLFCYHPI